jgi:hypothetical protein
MNIQTRLTKLEKQLNVTDDLCRCPDTLALANTPFWKCCYKCGKDIDVTTWQSWRMVHVTPDTNYFAFGLRRDDSNELKGKPNDYFKPQVFEVLRAWELLDQTEEQT